MATRVLEESSQRRIYARKLRSLQFLVVQVLTVAVAIGPTSEFWAGKPEQIRIAAGLVAGSGYLFSWRVARLAIVVEGDELIIRNLFRTYRLERSSISAIEQPSRRAQRLLYTLKAGIRVVRADGRVVSATAYVVTPVDGPVGAGDFAKHEVGELTEWLKTGEPSARPADRAEMRAVHMADGQEQRVNIGFFAWRAWLVILALLSVFGASLILSVMIDPLAN
ncbi:MAG TPA: hypothetical protein VFH56_04100 [Acidimicrobiales bacterium]|nr:hypothetical protein [Acidimicrobiales bacterium]